MKEVTEIMQEYFELLGTTYSEDEIKAWLHTLIEGET